MALTKAQLIERIRSNNDLTKKQSTDIVEATIDIMKDALASGDDVLISGFGKFRVKQKAERKGRNPATGDDQMLPARKVVTPIVANLGKRSMERENIICIFCGRIAKIKEQDDLKIVVCPKCKRETELGTYQDIFDQWLGDVRNKDGET